MMLISMSNQNVSSQDMNQIDFVFFSFVLAEMRKCANEFFGTYVFISQRIHL